MANLARELANVSIDDYPDTRLLPFFNVVKDDFWSYLITAIRANYNWDIWTVTQTVINQSEYVIPEAATDKEWNLKISWLWICYDWDKYDDWRYKYVKAREVNIQSLQKHWNYYLNNQPKTDPIYYIADKSIFIAPTFDKVLPDAIEIRWIKNIVDYTVDSTEEDIKLPSYLHMDLVQWVLPFIHKAEWRLDEASYEQKIYEQQRELAVKKFANRSVWPSYLTFPQDIVDPILWE